MAQETKKNIVIIGGSYGGMSIAHYTLKHTIPKLPEKENYLVVLISISAEAICRPGCPRALLSDEYLDFSKFFVSVPKQFEQYPRENFQFIQGVTKAWDHVKRTVTVSLTDNSTKEIDYYALVIATGCSTQSPLLGLNQGDSYALRNNWKDFRKHLSTAKSIVIGGGGPAGVETAGELAEELNPRTGFLSSKSATPKVSITLVTAAPQLLPYMREALGNKAEDQLTKLGITVVKNTRIKGVEPKNSGAMNATLGVPTKVLLEDGKELEADIYIPAMGMTANTEFVTDKSLLTKSGQVEVNAGTLRAEKAGERVYAIGDAASAHRPAIHLMTEAIPFLGNNLKRDLMLAAGKADGDKDVPKEKTYKEDTRETQIVPIGKSVTTGVGVVMGWAVPGVAVWLVKGRDYWLWTTSRLWSGNQWSKELA